MGERGSRIDWDKWRESNPCPTRQWKRGKCPQCGARTLKEASGKCEPYQLPCGDYYCGIDEDNQPKPHFGYIYERTEEFMDWSGRYWSAHAYDEGYTDQAPEGAEGSLI